MDSRPVRSALAAVLLCTLLFTLPACQAAASPADTIVKFQDAYNRLDMNAALACVEPTQANAMKGMIDLLGGVSGLGVGADTLFGILPMFAGMTMPEGSQGAGESVFPKMSITVRGTTVQGDQAECPVYMTISAAGQTQALDGVCTLTRQNGVWYIVDMR